MEPTVESLVLHPAVLIASGYECITSSQVRFLNAHRRHFHAKIFDLNQTMSITSEDFSLSGILNPYGHFHDVDTVYRKMSEHIPNFPYLTRREILQYFYKDSLANIWSEMMYELYGDLSKYCVQHKVPNGFFSKSTAVIHQLSNHAIYQKITALHLCGLGSKLIDAFDYVFCLFKSYENRASHPITAH